jgi:hypothetical protein
MGTYGNQDADDDPQFEVLPPELPLQFRRTRWKASKHRSHNKQKQREQARRERETRKHACRWRKVERTHFERQRRWPRARMFYPQEWRSSHRGRESCLWTLSPGCGLRNTEKKQKKKKNQRAERTDVLDHDRLNFIRVLLHFSKAVSLGIVREIFLRAFSTQTRCRKLLCHCYWNETLPSAWRERERIPRSWQMRQQSEAFRAHTQ